MTHNPCPKTNCLGCWYYSPEFAIEDDTGRKCLLAYTDLGEMTEKEIGYVLGITKSAVGMSINRSLRKMRKLFGVPEIIKAEQWRVSKRKAI